MDRCSTPAPSLAAAHSGAAIVAAPDAAHTPTQQPATPLTPLQLRQWQRTAQRSVRLALTAFKAARSRIQEATDAGTSAATQLTNSTLTACYMPSMPLPEALQAVEGLKAAAVAKLGRRQLQHLQQLSQAVEQVAAAVASMELALAEMRAQLPGQQQLPASGAPQDAAAGVGVTQPYVSPTAVSSPSPAAAVTLQTPPQSQAAAAAVAAAPPADARCSRMPVFHAIPLPGASAMLQRVLQMHQRDLALKQQVVDSFASSAVMPGGQGSDAAAAGTGGLSAAAVAAAMGSGSSGGKGSAGADAAEVLRRRLTVLLTCWMTSPHVDEEEAGQLLQVLTDEMTGF